MLSKLYLITDSQQCHDILALIEKALKGGVRLIQLREKKLSSQSLFHLAQKCRKLTLQYHAKLIINDRIDIALSVEADGLHVGKNSLPITVLKKLCKNQPLMIGYSAHSLSEAIAIEKEGVDWITFSPIYETASKMMYGLPQGIKKLSEVVNHLSIPVYALGGITINRIDELMQTGVYGVALISEIIASQEPDKVTQTLLSKLYET